jgi:drug/metabolite transporter (DMT)-like permease
MRRDRPGLERCLLALALAAGFSFLWAAIEHFGAGIRVSPYQVVWTRYGTPLAFLLLLFGFRSRAGLVRTGRIRLHVLASLLMLAMPVCFILAVGRMSADDVMVVFWAGSLVTVVASGLLDRERSWLVRLTAMAAASAGAILITRPHVGASRFAFLASLGMAASFAGYQVTLRQLAGEPILPKLVHTALWVFLALTLLMPLVWRKPSARDLLIMSLIGVVGCLALLLLDCALEIASPAILAPAICTQPVWVELLAGRRPTGLKVVGTVLILGAIAVVSLWRDDAARRGAAAAAGAGA